MDRPKLREMNSPGVPPSGAAANQPGVSFRPDGAESSGDAELWFADLVQAHTRRVFALLYRMTGNAGDAQDLSQEAFLKAWQNRRQLRDRFSALARLAASRIADGAVAGRRESGRVARRFGRQRVNPRSRQPARRKPEPLVGGAGS